MYALYVLMSFSIKYGSTVFMNKIAEMGEKTLCKQKFSPEKKKKCCRNYG